MAKRKKRKSLVPPEIKGLLTKYKDTIVMHLLSLLEAKGKNLLEALKNIGHIREKIKRFFISMELMFFGVFFILFGVAIYLQKLWPQLTDGLNYLLVGLVLVVVAWIYKNAK